MKILVSNVGSTSLKFKLFDMKNECLLCEAKVERVGNPTDAIYSYKNHVKNYSIYNEKQSVSDYTKGIGLFLDSVTDTSDGVISDIAEISSIGFKTVLAKGYYGVHPLNDEVLKGMKEYLFIAPVHNQAYLDAIDVFRKLLPETLMIGVFETAFHKTIPIERKIYSIPYEWYERYGIARLGFHGASHSYIAEAIVVRTGKAGKIISCHLGGSSSICAIDEGRSVDCSFGFSPQSGVPHANRVGDIDSYLIPFLLNEGFSLDEILEGLSKKAGLLGISGVSNDLRDIEKATAEGNERAKLAINVLVQNIIRYIGSFYAELGGLDHLVFTGGIGENSAMIRTQVCSRLSHLGIMLDKDKNLNTVGECRISQEQSSIDVWAIPANEEIGIARLTYKYLKENV